MIRRTSWIATVATLISVALITTSAAAIEPARETLDLRTLFERAPGVRMIDGDNGTITVPASVEVVVARIGPDGKLIKACVDSEEAARRFLTAPLETLRTRQAKEQ